MLWTVSFSALLSLVFWAANGIFWGAGIYLSCYRIVVPQPPPSEEVIRDTLNGALVDQLLVRPLLLYAVFPLFRARGTLVGADALPDARQLLVQVCFCGVRIVTAIEMYGLCSF